MKKKMMVLAVAFGLVVNAAHAGLLINWYGDWGFYPNGAASLTTVTVGTGVAAVNNVLWELVWTGPNGVANLPDPSNSGAGYAGGDDVVYDFRVITAGGSAGFDEWLYRSPYPQAYSNATYSLAGSSNFYSRVFQDTSPAVGEHYYDSTNLYLVAANKDVTEPTTIPQSYDVNQDSVTRGDALYLTITAIPEPTTIALGLVGLGALLVRRFRRS